MMGPGAMMNPEMYIAAIPPQRTAGGTASGTASGSVTPSKRESSDGPGFGKKAMDWGFKVSDKLSVYANTAANKVGAESFWPAAGDTPKELDKCARILNDFTDAGVEHTTSRSGGSALDRYGQKLKQEEARVIKKIPPEAIAQAKGIAIYTAFRTAIAPLGGAGGAGVILARLPDGSWSPPSSISPNNLSTGFMIGVDFYDVVLIIRTEKALEAFYNTKFSLGGEVSVAAGPVGVGAMLDSGKEMAPCWSYVKSRGFYAGVELNGTVIVHRTDEMARFYHRSEITAREILTGTVDMPYEAKFLLEVLRKAENKNTSYAQMADEMDSVPIPEDFKLQDGETLHLPPTPDMLSKEEGKDSDFRQSWRAAEEREQRKSIEIQKAEDRAYLQRMGPPPKRTSIPSGEKSVPRVMSAFGAAPVRSVPQSPEQPKQVEKAPAPPEPVVPGASEAQEESRSREPSLTVQAPSPQKVGVATDTEPRKGLLGLRRKSSVSGKSDGSDYSDKEEASEEDSAEVFDIDSRSNISSRRSSMEKEKPQLGSLKIEDDSRISPTVPGGPTFQNPFSPSTPSREMPNPFYNATPSKEKEDPFASTSVPAPPVASSSDPRQAPVPAAQARTILASAPAPISLPAAAAPMPLPARPPVPPRRHRPVPPPPGSAPAAKS